MDAARRAFDLISYSLPAHRGQRLPQEHDLVRDCGESRNSVRTALADLQRSGMITRERRVGTATAGVRFDRSMGRLSTHAGPIAQPGSNVVQQLINFERRPAPRIVRGALGIGEEEIVFSERLTRVDGHAVWLRSSWLLAGVVDEITESVLALDSVELIQAAYHEPIGASVMSVSAITADARLEQLFDTPLHAPLLRTTRLVSRGDGAVVELGFSRYRADSVVLSFDVDP